MELINDQKIHLKTIRTEYGEYPTDHYQTYSYVQSGLSFRTVMFH